MKLFFDEDISYRILKKVEHTFPNSVHTSSVGLNGKTDREIRKFCEQNNYTIVTFDADFHELANLLGHPPKIIWIRSRNLTTNNIAKIINEFSLDIKDFIERKEYKNLGCLEIDS